jgi:hypothetical protein
VTASQELSNDSFKIPIFFLFLHSRDETHENGTYPDFSLRNFSTFANDSSETLLSSWVLDKVAYISQVHVASIFTGYITLGHNTEDGGRFCYRNTVYVTLRRTFCSDTLNSGMYKNLSQNNLFSCSSTNTKIDNVVYMCVLRVAKHEGGGLCQSRADFNNPHSS